jgi:PAS domain-containing protein
MADAREPRKKKAAPRAADELRRPHLADDLRRPTSAADLRRQAEERLAELSAGAAAASAPEELAAGVHELRVNQIELEMQTEELLRAQLELEEQRAKYFDLFDLAPVGYLTINEKGIVGEANLTAARLLGVERQNLDGQRFSAFVFAADRDAHYL